MEKIILLSGKAENGKSTTAKIMKEELEKQGKKVLILNFAKYIKEFYRVLHPDWNGEKTEDVRSWLQNTGENINSTNPNFHSDRLIQEMEVYRNDIDVIIIDDWRYRREGYRVLSVFPDIATTVRVCRLGHKSKLTQEQLNHISETDLDNFNFNHIIYNQSMGSLHDETLRILKRIFKEN